MMTDINKIGAIILLILFLTSSLGSLSSPVKTIRQKLISKEIEIELPEPFHIQSLNEDESISYIYSFPHSAYIIICEGALISFPTDQYDPDSTLEIDHRKIQKGLVEGKFWRKDEIEDMRFYYNDVSLSNKSTYDEILDSIKYISFTCNK